MKKKKHKGRWVVIEAEIPGGVGPIPRWAVHYKTEAFAPNGPFRCWTSFDANWLARQLNKKA